jgi:phage terminase Nu1 subunit (DNA packaging protein)
MDDEITTANLARLFDVTPKTIADLGKRGVIVPGTKRGTWQRDVSITRYVRHLRSEAAARGGEAGASARERLGQAQAVLAETKAKVLSGELVEAADVEAFWRGKLTAFRARVLAIPSRVKDLNARQSVSLSQELRQALNDLADG